MYFNNQFQGYIWNNKQKMARVRSFALAANDYNDSTIENLKNFSLISYGIIYKRIAFDGKRHLHGYLQINTQQTVRALQKKLNLAGIKCYVVVAKRSQKERHTRCLTHSDWEEWGTPKRQGERTDLAKLYQMARDGKTNLEIGEEMPEAYMKYYKAVEHVRQEPARKRKLAEAKETDAPFWFVKKTKSIWTTEEHVAADGLVMLKMTMKEVWD